MKNRQKLNVLKTNAAKPAGILAAGMLLAAQGNLIAAPGTLSDSPLFLSTAVQPNIFFMIDDSGSMNWEVLLSNGALQAHTGVPTGGTLDRTPNDINELREYCVGYNVLAYDPLKKYTAWTGLDSNGNTYPDMTAAAARGNPWFTTTTNVSSYFYMSWNDNGDGIYQAGECPVPTAFGTTLSSTECAASPVCTVVSSLSTSEQNNYANWYSYYRKREYVMKRAMSSVINTSTARAGLATLNANSANSLDNNSNSIFSPVRDIDNISTPVDATAASNKKALMKSLFLIDSSNGTPLRRGLEDAGKYYEGQNPNGWGSTPILPASQGGECQQNFSILMSDGYWNGGNPSVGNTDTDGAGNFDGGVYADGLSNTLADVAMDYYERDLSPGLNNKVRTITGVDENSAQHMVSYTVAFGVNGTVANDPPDGATTFTWPSPFGTTAPFTTLNRVDDMRHAAYNGRGEFLSAGNAQQLIDSLNGALADIQDRNGTAAAVTFNSTSLNTGTRLLKAEFNTDGWSGNVNAYNLNYDATTNALTLGSKAWDAASKLDSNPLSSRKIVSYDGSAGIAFQWSSLTSAQQDDLRTNMAGTQDAVAAGQARLAYIRGERSCEKNSTDTCSATLGKVFRDRTSRLGDIIHSSPTYVGVPNTAYPDNIETVPYHTFVSSKASRPGRSYVGSNDGMLHAFDDNGVETFAYIPNAVYSDNQNEGLHYLTDPGYKHRYYVDLSVNVADAYISAGGGSQQWRSILVGGMRGGGKSLFAIDVTNPGSMTSESNIADKVLWEFTHDKLGYTFSDIRVGKLNNGKWAAIFGNGYNNDPLGDGKASIFIVYLDGSNVANPIILESHVGSISNGSCDDGASDCNGMSTPAILDLNGNGTIDRIYAGDLQGNMWVFDVSSSSDSSWVPDYGSLASPEPLFRACSGTPCNTANRQPITSKPSVSRHLYKRDATTKPNLMVFFGTGQYLTQADSGSTADQTFYGVWDSGTSNIKRNDLISQVLTDTTNAGYDVRLVTDNPVDYGNEYGWKIDLPSNGERSVTNPLALGSVLFFNTVIPTTGACDNGGEGWLMAVDLINGGMPKFQPLDINNDGKFDLADMIGSDYTVGTKSPGIPTESRFIADKRVTANSDGSLSIDNIQSRAASGTRRMSWTEVER